MSGHVHRHWGDREASQWPVTHFKVITLWRAPAPTPRDSPRPKPWGEADGWFHTCCGALVPPSEGPESNSFQQEAIVPNGQRWSVLGILITLMPEQREELTRAEWNPDKTASRHSSAGIPAPRHGKCPNIYSPRNAKHLIPHHGWMFALGVETPTLNCRG